MNWIVETTRGEVIKQIDNKMFKDIDSKDIKKLTLYENPNDVMVNFHGELGFLDFSNLSFDKIEQLQEGKLNFIFDPITKRFCLDEQSLEFYKDISVIDPNIYTSVSVDNNGCFWLNDKLPIYVEVVNEENVILSTREDNNIDNIYYWGTGQTDLYLRYKKDKNLSEILNRKDKTIKYDLGYEREYENDDVHIKILHNICIDFVRKDIQYKVTFIPLKPIKHELRIVCGEGDKSNITKIGKGYLFEVGETYDVNKVITTMNM